MKTLSQALFLLPLMATGAFAQTPAIDVDAINQTAASQAASVDVDHTNSSKKDFSKLGKHIAEGLNPKFSRSISKDRELTDSDDAKISLVRCAERMLKNNNGGANAPAVAFGAMMAAMDQNGWSTDRNQIEAAAARCQQLSKEIVAYSNSKVDRQLRKDSLIQIEVSNAAAGKVKALIGSLENPNSLECQVSSYTVTAGALIMPKVGFSGAKCLWSNGKIYKFFGPTLGFAVGIGADFVQERYILEQRYQNLKESTPLHVFSNGLSSYAYMSSSNDPMKGYIITGIGSVYGKEHGTKDDYLEQGIAIGASRRGSSNSASTFGIRMFNGKRQWGNLVDRLN